MRNKEALMSDALWESNGLFDQTHNAIDRLDLPEDVPSALLYLTESVGGVASGLVEGSDADTRHQLIQTAATALALAARFPKQ